MKRKRNEREEKGAKGEDLIDDDGREESQRRILNVFKEHSSKLDGKNDRRERIMKFSRDLVIWSKRMIFQVHRAINHDQEKRNDEIRGARKGVEKLVEIISKIGDELKGDEDSNEGIDFAYWKYHSALSFGIQEYVEAICFLQFVEKGNFPSISDINNDFPFRVSLQDFLGGVADFTGELMRVCVNSLGEEDKGRSRLESKNVADDHLSPLKMSSYLRSIHQCFFAINPGSEKMKGSDFRKKLLTMKQSLQKVEEISFKLRLREMDFTTISKKA